MNHGEAFSLMLYRNRKTGREEWLWNSRDGVTPFCITDAEDGGEMVHVEYFRDVRAPFYVPPVGSRIFVDLTEANARIHAASWSDRFAAEDAEFVATVGDRDAAIESMVRNLLEYGGGGSPDILVVNAAMQADLRARQPAPAPRRSTGRFA